VILRRLLELSLCAAVGLMPLELSADDAVTPLRSLEAALIEAIATAEQSVVALARVPQTAGEGVDRIRAESAFGTLPTDSGYIPTDFGSGVIIPGDPDSEERFVLTAAHVVLGQRTFGGALDLETLKSAQIYVRLASRHVVAAPLVAADQRSDLAVLRLPLKEAGIPLEAAPPFVYGDAAALRKGSFVVALGNPYAIARDGSASASVGIVSNISRRPWPPRGVLVDPTEQDLTIHHYGTLLQVDTRLNLGTSGGALINADGKLVGLTTSLAALEGYEKSVGYAVPLDAAAQRIIESLRAGYEAEYGFLGIQPGEADPELMQRLSLQTSQATAARVRFVSPGSPADEAGLKPNDVILSVNATAVYSDVDLVREIGWLGPDATARLQVVRPESGKAFDLDARLAKWPVYDDSLLVTTRERHPPWRGLHIDYSTARRRYLPANPLGAFPRGVVVTGVDPGSPAADAELFEGQFIVELAGQSIHSPSDFSEAVNAISGEATLQLGDGRTVTLRDSSPR